jgi:hypothetical protein
MDHQGSTTGQDRGHLIRPNAAWLFAAIAVLVGLQLACFAYDRLPDASLIQSAVQDAIGQAWNLCR